MEDKPPEFMLVSTPNRDGHYGSAYFEYMFKIMTTLAVPPRIVRHGLKPYLIVDNTKP